MATAVDWSKVGRQAAQHEQKHEDLKTKMIVTVGNAIGRIYDNNPNDPRLEVVQMLLGTEKMDQEKLLSLLGVAPSASTGNGSRPDQPPALPAPPAKRYPLFDVDGMPTGTPATEADAITNGYIAMYDPDDNSKVIAYKQTRRVGEPTNLTPLNKEVEVHDSKSRKVDTVKVGDGNKDNRLEAILGDDGQVDHFLVKSRFVRRNS